MCGIAGVVALTGAIEDADASAVAAMAGALAHRGPDGLRSRRDGRCVLANTRLKVTDLSDRGALPMSNEADTVWLGYNGAITNHRQLKARHRLADKFKFQSASDSEVLLRLYEDRGLECLGELTGMFAFCLYDRPRRRLTLVRDFYGLRPLFYSVQGGRIYFASEIKALLEMPGFKRRVDLQAAWHFFSLGYVPGARTAFEGIRELPGGHLLEVDLDSGEWKLKRHYKLDYRPDEIAGVEETARSLRGALLESVRRNIDVDAPVGFTLSGGVDTSSLLVLGMEAFPERPLHTFSIRMKEASFDESRFQKIMVDHSRSVHHEIAVGPAEVVDGLRASIAFMDEPSANGAVVPTYLLAREAKKHVSVLISGEGGDEIFNAYETHRAHRLRALYRKAPALLRGAVRALAERLPVRHNKLSFDFLMKRFTQGAELDVPRSHFYWRHVFTDAEKGGLLEMGDGLEPSADIFAELFEGLTFKEEIDKIAFCDLEYYFIDDLMVKNDRMLMAHSIEGRFPYMDREVVELASRIPARFKVRGLQGRSIQKLAMRGSLPPAIAARTNMGLEMPHSVWFLGPLRGFVAPYFSRKNIARYGFLKLEAVARLWDDHASGRRDNGRPLWCLLNFILWYDLFIASDDYKRQVLSP